MNSFSSSTNLTVEQKLAICQERIQYTFRDTSILICALTHSSGAANRLLSNERLEFLGDAVLGFCVCEWLFAEHPEYLEGELTQIKSVVVSRRCCAKISRRLGLEECLILGKGMQSAAGVPRSLLSDVFESVIAAIYLDGGFEPARKFIIESLKDELSLALQEHTIGNFKSALQQLAQREHGIAPCYKLIGERGPDHSKQFKIEAEIGPRKFTAAWARNKKEAEQRAAGNALAELRGEAAPYLD